MQAITGTANISEAPDERLPQGAALSDRSWRQQTFET
jgi:hypothetical protein